MTTVSEAARRLRAARAHRARAGGSRPRSSCSRALYPLIVDSLQELPLLGDFVPGTGSMVVMLVFTMMALGLNVVVGYAGLLDLGYVAFYAAGAYVAGWFASLQFEQVTLPPRLAVDGDLPASTSRCGSCSSSPGSSRRPSGS